MDASASSRTVRPVASHPAGDVGDDEGDERSRCKVVDLECKAGGYGQSAHRCRHDAGAPGRLKIGLVRVAAAAHVTLMRNGS